MKKDTVRSLVVAAVILAVYHLIVFAVPFAKTAVFWISYGFSLAAFALAMASLYYAFLRKSDAKSKFYGFPIARIGVVYGLAQLTVGLGFMALGQWIPWWLVLTVCALGFAVAAVGLVGAESVTEEIRVQDGKLKTDVRRMRSLQSKVSRMAAQTGDAAIAALAEEFRYSDPVSDEAIADAEEDLAAAVEELQAAVVDDDKAAVAQLCRRISALLSERNRLCRLNKK